MLRVQGDEENLYVLQPKTPPQQSYMRGYRMDSQMMTAGSWDVANSMCASEGMPGALRAALTDAIMRDNVPELVAALDSGLSPDATLQWCPPEGGTGIALPSCEQHKS